MATNHFTHASVLALNAVLVESPESLTTGAFAEITSSIIVQGIASSQPFIADNCSPRPSRHSTRVRLHRCLRWLVAP